jgi:multiple sugar transport system substrate-binding protein
MNPNTPSTGSMPSEGEIPVLGPQGANAKPPVDAPQILAKPSRRFPKKLLFMVLGLVFLLVGVFAVFKLVVPRLGEISGNGHLVWWGLWEDDTLVKPLIDEYQAANPGVTIEYIKNDKQDYRDRLMSALAKGDGPDIFRIHNSWVPVFRQDLSAMPSSLMSSQEFGSTFYPVAADDLIGVNGPYAIPLEYDGLAMFINTEIFTTYGATIPVDWNELRDTAKALTIKDERGVITQSGAALGTTANVDHWPEIVALLMLQNGADPNIPSDSAGRGGQALSFYKQFAAIDQVWDDTLPESTVAFATGRVGIYFGPSWRALEIMERNPSLKFRVESVPQVPKSDPNAPDITYASYWAEAVNAKSKNSQEAWKFLKFLSTKESLTKLYENASRTRPFGEPYSRVDMRDLLLGDPVVGGFLRLAPVAKSGFLHSRTYDGTSGINTSLAEYYADALADINPSRGAKVQLTTLSAGVNQVLSRYGLQAPAATPK